jgi:hypothetical protein
VCGVWRVARTTNNALALVLTLILAPALAFALAIVLAVAPALALAQSWIPAAVFKSTLTLNPESTSIPRC